MTDNLTLNMDAYLPLRDVVFNTLREAILKGELQPGERLMELQLASKLGVSRTPIREAIRFSQPPFEKRKERPPIVGVFSFDLCQRGPISSIFCPIFMLFSLGIRKRQQSAVNAKTDISDIR